VLAKGTDQDSRMSDALAPDMLVNNAKEMVNG
jgi:hypothetical protein